MMNKRSSSSRTTISTVTTIAVASAVLVSTLAVVPLVEQAHALDITELSDYAKSMAKGIHDIFGNQSTPQGHDNP
jgi:hypothetical protein